jgi:putative peptide zinc metalloprotease protein
MADTDDYLRNLWARARRSPHRVDQSGIPPKEMRIIRWYSVLWFFGRLVSGVIYALVVLPVLWGYTYQFILLLTGNHTRFTSWDFATVGILVILLNGGGLVMWHRGLYRGGRERRRLSNARRVDGTKPAPEPAGIG